MSTDPLADWTLERRLTIGDDPEPHLLTAPQRGNLWLTDAEADQFERAKAITAHRVQPQPDELRALPDGVLVDNEGRMWSLGSRVPWRWETFRVGQGWFNGRDLASTCLYEVRPPAASPTTEAPPAVEWVPLHEALGRQAIHDGTARMVSAVDLHDGTYIVDAGLRFTCPADVDGTVEVLRQDGAE